MIALRLFGADDVGRQLEMRRLSDGERVTLGRDASAQWVLADPDRALSRQHVTVALRDGQISVTDTSTNGVTLAGRDQRLARNEATLVDLGERLEFGPYMLLIERADPTAPYTPPPPRRGASNPFAPAASDADELIPRRRAKGFAPALAQDPLTPERPFEVAQPDPFAPGDPLAEGEAWGRAGHGDAWDAGAPRPQATRARIGTPGDWVEPPADPSREDFGFNDPFTRPVLASSPARAEDFAIPADWADSHPVSAPASPPRPVAAPPAAADAGGAEADPLLAPRGKSRARAAASAATTPQRPGPFGAGSQAAAPPEEDAGLAEGQRQPSASPVPDHIRPAAPAAGDALLAFCTAAGLDPAAFAADAPDVVMARLGTVYRSMVLGLSDVMGERTSLKNEYRMARTTVQAAQNNPFKWSPPPRVAVDLLRAAEDGFLPGPEAVTESFGDVKKHLLCILAGLRAALGSTLDHLAPERIEGELKDQPFMLKTRAGAAWSEYAKAHAKLRSEAQDSADSTLNKAFRAGYEAQLSELDRFSSRGSESEWKR